MQYKTANKRFNNLVRGGYIDKNNSGLAIQFGLSEKGKQAVRNFSQGLGRNFFNRSHNLTYKCEIKRWSDYAFKDGKFKVNTKVKNWKKPQYYTTLANGTQIQTSDSYVIIRIKQINAPNADSAIMQAFDEVIKILQDLMSKYPGLVIACPEKVGDLITQHHAIHNHFISQLLEEFKIKYKDDRVEIDSSKGKPEIEFISPAHAQGDFQRLIDFIHAVITGEFDWKGSKGGTNHE